jgi:hypothetical protein
METTRPTGLDVRIAGSTAATTETGSEWTARPLRPVAHWVLMPTSGRRARLEMVWGVPDPMPSQASL